MGKHVQRGTRPSEDDRTEVPEEGKDEVWEGAVTSKNHPVLRPWHKDYWRRG